MFESGGNEQLASGSENKDQAMNCPICGIGRLVAKTSVYSIGEQCSYGTCANCMAKVRFKVNISIDEISESKALKEWFTVCKFEWYPNEQHSLITKKQIARDRNLRWINGRDNAWYLAINMVTGEVRTAGNIKPPLSAYQLLHNSTEPDIVYWRERCKKFAETKASKRKPKPKEKNGDDDKGG